MTLAAGDWIPRRIHRLIIQGGLGAVLLAGCSSLATPETPGGRSGGREATARKDSTAGLQPGMTPDEVRQLLGKPARVRPVKTPEGPVEVWSYQRRLDTRYENVPSRMVERQIQDPLTGVITRIQEQTNSQQEVTVWEEVELIWLDGRLVSWRRREMEESNYR